MRLPIPRFRLRTLLLVAPILAALIGWGASRYLEHSAYIGEQRARDTLRRKTAALGGNVRSTLSGPLVLTVDLSKIDATDSELRWLLPYTRTWFEKQRYPGSLRINVVGTRVTNEGVAAFRHTFPNGVVKRPNVIVRRRPYVTLVVDQHLIEDVPSQCKRERCIGGRLA